MSNALDDLLAGSGFVIFLWAVFLAAGTVERFSL